MTLIKRNYMKRFATYQALALLVLASFFITGCEAIAGIFKAGVWVGVLAVVGIIAVIVAIFSRSKK